MNKRKLSVQLMVEISVDGDSYQEDEMINSIKEYIIGGFPSMLADEREYAIFTDSVEIIECTLP